MGAETKLLQLLTGASDGLRSPKEVGENGVTHGEQIWRNH